MERRYDRPIVWWSNVYFDRLGIIRWDCCSVVDLILGHIKLFIKSYILYFLSCKKKKIIIINDNFERNFAKNWVKKIKFYLSHCFTELFPIYQNKHWTIRRRNDRFVVPLFHPIISKIDGFQHTHLQDLAANMVFWFLTSERPCIFK